jgi:hypothetical protein
MNQNLVFGFIYFAEGLSELLNRLETSQARTMLEL